MVVNVIPTRAAAAAAAHPAGAARRRPRLHRRANRHHAARRPCTISFCLAPCWWRNCSDGAWPRWRRWRPARQDGAMRLGLPGCIMMWSEWFGWRRTLLAGNAVRLDVGGRGWRRGRLPPVEAFLILSNLMVISSSSTLASRRRSRRSSATRWARAAGAPTADRRHRRHVCRVARDARRRRARRRPPPPALFVGDGATRTCARSSRRRYPPSRGTSCLTDRAVLRSP